ncbi:hypothetical protein ACSS6W_003017 [Trichoderma asperelloides]
MSSSLIGVSSTSLDTPILSSTAIRNASSIAIKPSDVPLSSSTSAFPVDSTQKPLTSSDAVIEAVPNTATTSSLRTPTTTASEMTTKETIVNSPTATPSGGSLEADGETPTSALPIPTSSTSQAASLTPSTFLIPTSSSISTQASSSAEKIFPQLSSTADVSSSVIPTATVSTQVPSITTSQSQSQTPTPKSSTSQAPAAPETEAIFPTPPLTSPKQPSSTIHSQSISPAAQPTDNSVQEPQVFSAADVAQPSETSSSASSTSIPEASSTAPIQGNNGFSAQEVSQPTNVAVPAAGGNAISNSSASTPTLAASSAPLAVPDSVASVSSSISASIPASIAIAAPISTPLSASTGVVGGSIPSGTQSNTITHATSLISDSTDGIGAFPTATNTSPSNLNGSGISESIQPTGQTIADPVSPSTNPSTATIVGGTVGGIAAAAFLVVLLWLLRRKLASRKSQESSKGGSFKPMAQKLGIATTLDAVKQNFGGKSGPRNVNMNRGNSQFLETVTVEPMKTPTYVKSQIPAAVAKKPSKPRKLGLSFDHGKLFNPFSDANALMSGKIPPPSSSILANPFTDDNMVLPPPVSAANRRRSRGRSLGGIKSFQAPAVPPRPHSVHRESLQSNESFAQRRDKFRSDPFDLELESRLVPQRNGVPSRASSVYSNNQSPQDSRDSYTSRYISGSSLGDWANGNPDAGAGGATGRRDSPTLS